SPLRRQGRGTCPTCPGFRSHHLLLLRDLRGPKTRTRTPRPHNPQSAIRNPHSAIACPLRPTCSSRPDVGATRRLLPALPLRGNSSLPALVVVARRCDRVVQPTRR